LTIGSGELQAQNTENTEGEETSSGEFSRELLAHPDAAQGAKCGAWFFTIENLGFHHRKWWFNGDLMGISWKITIFNG